MQNHTHAAPLASVDGMPHALAQYVHVPDSQATPYACCVLSVLQAGAIRAKLSLMCTFVPNCVHMSICHVCQSLTFYRLMYSAAGAIRAKLLDIAYEYVFPYGAPVRVIVDAISALRASASGKYDDIGLFYPDGSYAIAASDDNAIAASRSTDQVRTCVCECVCVCWHQRCVDVS